MREFELDHPVDAVSVKANNPSGGGVGPMQVVVVTPVAAATILGFVHSAAATVAYALILGVAIYNAQYLWKYTKVYGN
ncbi:hypothetical protein [Desulfothermobacter acidiphilus]|uniref:hypothetical protein n=1 Tax=Desulfothermobacter acidiphilus TaxID=1938353 RepID=UPI003F88BF65